MQRDANTNECLYYKSLYRNGMDNQNFGNGSCRSGLRRQIGRESINMAERLLGFLEDHNADFWQAGTWAGGIENPPKKIPLGGGINFLGKS